jgi:hypothetical protein
VSRRAFLALVLPALVAGCAPDRQRATTPTTAAAITPAPPAPAPAPAPVLLGELEARALIAGELRRAGYRIRHDVPLAAGGVEVVLDGWDADRAAGFEYVASFAGDPPLDVAAAAALSSLATGGLLVIAAGSEAGVRDAVASFLAARAGAPTSTSTPGG